MLRSRICWIPMFLLTGLLILSGSPATAQESGEAIFARICKACHTIGQGTLVGPDLAGVSQRRSQQWIIPYVQSSQTVIKSGDPDAVALFEKFNKVIMPDNPLGRNEVMSVIRYIEEIGGGPVSAAVVLPTPLETASEEDLIRGAALFQGRLRLAAGGPACNSCHHLNKIGIMGGGTLARDLTEVISRMPALGVQAILSNPPFPVMQQAYVNHALTEDEIFALTALLEKLNADKILAVGSTHGKRVFVGGTAGVILLFALFSLIWIRRKKAMVYRDIYRRQMTLR